MKPFRHALLLVMTLSFLGLHRQVSAQENTEETVPTELVERVAETKPSETDLTAVEEHQIDEIRTFVPASPNPLPEPQPVSDTLETNEVDEEDEEDLPEFDLSNIDQVIDQLYPSATALEEDIVAKSEEDEAFKAYVDASLKTEALVSRYLEWQAQFSTDTEAPDIEAFLSEDVAQTEDFKAFVYKGIISDWLIGQYLNSLAEKSEHEAALEKKAVEAILSSQPRSEEELETYFYAKLYSDDKLKTYFYTNLKSDPLIRQYFEALDDEEGLLETFGELSPDDKRRLRAYFYQTLQRDGYFRSYFYQTTDGDGDGDGELSEGSHFFKSVPNIQPGDKRRKKSKPNPQPQPIAPTLPAYVPPRRPPYNTDGPNSGQRNPILDQEAADHSPNGRTNISFKDLENRGVRVSDKHYEVNAQYHRDSLARQIARGLEPNRYHYDSLNSYYNNLREKRGVSPTSSSSYRPVASAQPGIGGFTAEEIANLEVKFLGRSNPTSSYSGSSYHSSTPSRSTPRPGVGGFSDDDVKRLMSKFDKLFTKPKTTLTGFKSELKNDIEVIKNSSDSPIKKTEAIVKAYESYLYNNNKQAFDEYWSVRKNSIDSWNKDDFYVKSVEGRLGEKLQKSNIDIKSVLNNMGDDILAVNPNTPYSPLVGGSHITATVLDNQNFIDLVNTGRPLDLKSRTFGDTTYSIWSRQWFVNMEPDYTGNYLYGYVGKGYLNSSDPYLKYSAGFAQVLSDGDISKWYGNMTSGHYGDNKQDAAFIQDGIDAYKANGR